MVQNRYLCIPYIRNAEFDIFNAAGCAGVPYRSARVFGISNLPLPIDAPIGRMGERRRTSAIITEYECASACGIAVDTFVPSSRFFGWICGCGEFRVNSFS